MSLPAGTGRQALSVAHARVLPALLLFASGAASLVFQVLWVRQLGRVVGVDVHAVAIGVGAFFGGLALGSWLIGRAAERSAQPLRWYAALEAGVALLGVGSTLALAVAAAPFARLEAGIGPLAWLLPAALVGLPAVLMGGTVPVLLRATRPAQPQLGGTGGRLYAANTAGAIAGTLLAAFVLIPQLGIRGSALAAAATSLLAAAGALAWQRARRGAGGRPAADAAPSPGRSDAGPRRATVLLYAAAGGLALGYELVWSQAIVPLMSTRAYAFAVMLATYLAGIALGAALGARCADRVRAPWAVFGLLIAAAGLVSLLEVAFLGRWLVVAQTAAEAGVLQAGGSDLAGMSARFAVAAAWMVLLPTLLLGAAFPFALRLGVDADRAARDAGALLAANTLGGIAGMLLAGFVLLPALGLVRTLAVLALAAAALGLVTTLKAPALALRGAGMAVAALAVVAAVATPPDKLASLLPGARGGALAFYDESPGGTVAVVESRGFKRLYIQGVSNSGDAMPSLRYMRLQSLLPLLIHAGEPRSALVIGLGTGITAGALLQVPALEQRVAAELLPAVVRAAPQFNGNYGAAADPRLQIRVRDGRRELLRSDQRYDLVTLEPPPPSAAGIANLYSTDFYRLAASRLQPQGLVAQWLPLPTQNIEDTRALVRSFLDVFPHATLWSTELHEMVLVGSLDPIVLDVPRIAERMRRPETAAALREVGVASPAALLATWVTDRAGLERFAADAAPVTDDHPRIEFGAWARDGEVTRVLPALLALATVPPLQGADAPLQAAVDAQRRTLWRFYQAGLHAYARDREAWAREMRRVVADDGDNPYYRWFTGGPR